MSNENLTDSSSGKYASITGNQGLTGSLSSGVNGKLVTGFTISVTFKANPGGPNTQFLLNRRLGDNSLTSLDYTLATGINNGIIFTKYSQLNPLSAVTATPTTPIVLSTDGTPTPSNIMSATGIIRLMNVGGGQLNWSASARTRTSVGNINWLSISSVLSSGTIHTINNLSSYTATITAYVNSSATSGLVGASSYNGSIIFYDTQSVYQKCPNFPIDVPLTLDTTSVIPP